MIATTPRSRHAPRLSRAPLPVATPDPIDDALAALVARQGELLERNVDHRRVIVKLAPKLFQAPELATHPKRLAALAKYGVRLEYTLVNEAELRQIDEQISDLAAKGAPCPF